MSGDESPYGVHDMEGNAQEWTASEYKAYPGGPSPNGSDYKRGMYVVRGASSALYGNDKEAPYKVWVRGYGLVDSQPVLAMPGRTLALTAVPAPNARAAAERAGR